MHPLCTGYWGKQSVQVMGGYPLLNFRGSSSPPTIPQLSIKEQPLTELCSGSEAGAYLRLIDPCITQLKAQGSETCNLNREEEEEVVGAYGYPGGGGGQRPDLGFRPSAFGFRVQRFRV